MNLDFPKEKLASVLKSVYEVIGSRCPLGEIQLVAGPSAVVADWNELALLNQTGERLSWVFFRYDAGVLYLESVETIPRAREHGLAKLLLYALADILTTPPHPGILLFHVAYNTYEGMNLVQSVGQEL